MQRTLIVLVLIGIIFTVVLLHVVTAYSRAVSSTVASNPEVAAFDSIYPNARHSITYYTGIHGTPQWNSNATLSGKYELTMQFGVRFNFLRTRTIATSEPKFLLVEIKDVSVSPSGQRTIVNGESKVFGPAEWNVLKAHRGDVGAINFPATKP